MAEIQELTRKEALIALRIETIDSFDGGAAPDAGEWADDKMEGVTIGFNLYSNEELTGELNGDFTSYEEWLSCGQDEDSVFLKVVDTIDVDSKLVGELRDALRKLEPKSI